MPAKKGSKTAGENRGKRGGGEKPSISQEAVAIFGIFVACFLYLSLFAYAFAPAQNLTGKVGVTIAAGMFDFMGWGAYSLPTLILLASLLFYRSHLFLARLPYVFAGISAAVISLCGLLSTFTLHKSSLINAGGFVGKTAFTLLDAVVGHGGVLMILVLLLLLSLMLAVRFSPYLLLCRIFSLVKKFFGGMVGVGKNIRIRPAEKAKSRGNMPALHSIKEMDREAVAPAVDIEEIAAPTEKPVLKERKKSIKESATEEEFCATPVARGEWQLPPLSFLTKVEQESDEAVDKDAYYKLSQQLEQKLVNFGVKGRVIGISPGPVVTTYEYSPAPGVKINKISGLADDLALGLRVGSVRVAGSIPGKAALGIEIPNKNRQVVPIRDLIGSEEYRKQSEKQKLMMVLGLDVAGNLVMANLARMPHLLIAGATGAGKSVGINTLIASILYNATPEEVRFLMVDPKRIELSGYEGIPHLLHPVVVEPALASRALNWAVREMERRYRLLEEAKVKSFDSYNKSAEEKLPYIVVVVDELADLMMVASKDVEASIARLAQMARAAGMHVILATQRPSVDVLTGLIKANFPTRMSFKVSSKIDSRTILDTSGAEHLLGMGDMLYLPNGGSLCRVHGAYISEQETAAIVDFWKEQGSSSYDTAIMEEIEKEESGVDDDGDKEYDDLYDQAVAFVSEQGQASISSVQRRLRVGYNRAARMIEMMEKDGIVGPADGAKPREVIVRRDYTDI